MPSTVLAVAASDTSGVLKKIEIERRSVMENDVDIEVKYCGICHSDLHQIRAEWPIPVVYPMVPGHEVVGVVKAVGSAVTKFKVGDRVGVGCIVDSCRDCAQCAKGNEQYCGKGMVGTYNSKTTWYGRTGPRTKLLPGQDAEVTFGGYSQSLVCDEKYVLRIPDALPLDKAAPLLCAGITTYSPLVYYGAKAKGTACTTGVIGFGGLGHMAVKLAKAMGNKVVVFSTSPGKKAAVEALGARFINSSDAADMASVTGTVDLIIDTASADHDINVYFGALATDGQFCVVGAPQAPFTVHPFSVIFGRRSVCGSLIGGIQETQETLDFCAANNIAADIELISPKDLNHAMVSLSKNAADNRRFVIDIAALTPEVEVEADAAVDPTAWKVLGFPSPPETRHPAHAAK